MILFYAAQASITAATQVLLALASPAQVPMVDPVMLADPMVQLDQAMSTGVTAGKITHYRGIPFAHPPYAFPSYPWLVLEVRL